MLDPAWVFTPFCTFCKEARSVKHLTAVRKFVRKFVTRQEEAATLAELERELLAYPSGPRTQRTQDVAVSAIAHPLKLRLGGEVLTFISTTTVFCTPLDVTLSELAIESFFPADEATARVLRQAAR